MKKLLLFLALSLGVAFGQNTNVQNAQNSLTLAQQDFSNLTSQVSDLTSQVSNLNAEVASLTAQNQSLQNLTVFRGLEWQTALVAGGSVANSSGNPGVAADAQGIPASSFAFRQIIPNGQYEDKYWYWKLGADASKSSFTYTVNFMLPDPSAPQALELDVQQVIAAVCYNVGFQFDFADNSVRIWNRSTTNHGWIATGVSSPRWVAGSWHSVTLKTHRDSTTVYYDSMTIDGVTTSLTQFSFPAISLSNPDTINVAIQLDANSAGKAFLANIYGVDFTEN